LRLNDARAMLVSAIAGIGIVKLHYYMVEEALQAGQLIEMLQEYSQTNYSIFLYYAQNRYLSPKIRYFIDFLLTKMTW
jgi:DNA-binding transcriptional LysR family regulator